MLRLPRSLRPPPGLAASWDRAVAHARRIVHRRRWIVHAAAIAAVALGASSGWSALTALRTAREAWGPTTPVAVARTALAPGDRADAATVSVQRWPAALVPPGALRGVPDAVVRQDVGPGEVLAAADVGASPGPAGMLADGEVAAVLALDESRRPPLAVGDRVGVVVGDERVASGTVLAVDALTVVVGVPSEPAASIAAAASNDAVALLLEP